MSSECENENENARQFFSLMVFSLDSHFLRSTVNEPVFQNSKLIYDNGIQFSMLENAFE